MKELRASFPVRLPLEFRQGKLAIIGLAVPEKRRLSRHIDVAFYCRFGHNPAPK